MCLAQSKCSLHEAPATVLCSLPGFVAVCGTVTRQVCGPWNEPSMSASLDGLQAKNVTFVVKAHSGSSKLKGTQGFRLEIPPSHL